MFSGLKRVVIEIERRGIVPVAASTGASIGCLRGRLWITELGCIKDILLEAGGTHVIVRDGEVLVQALRDAIVRLEAPPSGPAIRARAERLWRWGAGRSSRRAALSFARP